MPGVDLTLQQEEAKVTYAFRWIYTHSRQGHDGRFLFPAKMIVVKVQVGNQDTDRFDA
jgi:hypothetical protein